MGRPQAADSSEQATDRRAAFRSLFEGGVDYVWLSLRRLGVAERDLEDVVQNVFLQVYRRLDDYDPSRPARAWLFGFAVRCAADWRKLARHRAELLGDATEAPAREAAPDERAAGSEALALLLRALENMTVERRAVLILHELDGVDMKDIAISLGIPLFTAYSRLRLARRDLGAALGRLDRRRAAP